MTARILALLTLALLAPGATADAAPAPEGFQVLGIGGAGGMYTPSVAPDGKLMLVSCDMSGAYRSLDAGRHWEMIHWRQISSCTGCRPLFTPGAVYWARGADLRVSRDQAKTWQPVAAGAAPWEGMAVTRLAALLPNAAAALPNAAAGLPTAPPGAGTVWRPARTRGTTPPVLLVGGDAGLWRSPDGGKTWAKAAAGKCYSVITVGRRAYASIDTRFLASGDAGATWQEIKVPELGERGFLSLAGGVDNAGKSRLFGTVFKVGILASEDEGKSWKLVDQFRDCNDLLMAGNQTEVAYAAQSGHGGAREIWRTRDGGKSWESCFRMEGADANVERSWVQAQLKWGYYISPLGMGINPADPNTVLVSTQGDFYLSRDAGTTWSQVMNNPVGVKEGDPGFRYACSGLEVTSCWQYLFDPFERDRRYIAYTDIGFARSVDGDRSWIWSAAGCPWGNTFYKVLFDPKVKGRLYAATSNRHDIPHWTHTGPNAPGHAGGVCVSDDYGAHWRVLGTGLPKLPCTYLCLDPKRPETFYTTLYEGGVYKSTDGGATWQNKSTGLGNAGNLHAYMVKVHPKTGDAFCSITAHRVGANQFPVPGGLWKSTDGGESWTDLTRDLRLHWPAGFALDPTNPEVIYLTASTVPGGPEGGLYKTADGGKSWTRVLKDEDFAATGGSSYVHCMFVNLHPDHPEWIYVGTATHGLWMSPDAGKTWKRFERLPFASAQNVTFDPQDPDTMYVTTFGGGVWKGGCRP